MKYFRYNLLLTMLLLFPFLVNGGNIRISVDGTRRGNSIPNNEVFYITYELTDVEGNPEKPSSVPGAKVLYFDRTGQSSRFSSINGKTSQTITYTYTVTCRAVKEGTYSFGPISVGNLKSNKVTYTIGADASSQKPDSQNTSSKSEGPKFIGTGNGNLFLRASLSKTSAYEQEALVYTVKLYTTFDAIKFVGAASAPKFEGFVIEESKAVSQSFDYETYNGKTYATAVIARYIVFPQMSGSLKIKGNTYTVSVDEREYYSDPFNGRLVVSRPMQLNVSPNDLSVNVKSLPLPKPADFSGGVGQFVISSSLPSTSLKTNQGANIIYTVNGTGNLKLVTLPDLNALYPSQIEVYSPQTTVNTKVGTDNVSGSVKFDYSIIPLEQGEYEIPAVTLVYFNPKTGKYEKSVSKSYKVNVTKGKASAKSQTHDRLSFDKELLPLGHLENPIRLNVFSLWYWLLYLIPSLIFVGTYIYYLNYKKTHSDIVGLKIKKASKVAQTRLKLAYKCMLAKDDEHFYDELLSALWGYLSDKLNIPTSSLTRQNVEQVLLEHNVPENIAKSVLELINNCEFAKYSPVSSESNMKEMFDQGEEVIDNLESLLKKKVNK